MGWVTYPDPAYLDEVGRVAASYLPGDRPPDLRMPTTDVRYLATGDSTNGQLGLYRWSMSERPGGAEPHFHRTFSESFYVVSGEVALYDGDRWVTGGAGDFLHVPVGGIHAFRNESGAPADMLILFVPGAPREQYFEALAEMAATGKQLGDDEKAAFLAAHDQYAV
jgi:quercetin dioxygenase-like cupin family protein